MIKRIVVFTLLVITLGVLGFYLNSYLVSNSETTLTFSIASIYLFNSLASIIIYTAVEVVLKYLPNETGYLYLGLMLVKFGVFILMFQTSIFSETGLTKPEKVTILVPILTFLMVEAIAVSKLLNNK